MALFSSNSIKLSLVSIESQELRKSHNRRNQSNFNRRKWQPAYFSDSCDTTLQYLQVIGNQT